jgi:hypothetical protein
LRLRFLLFPKKNVVNPQLFPNKNVDNIQLFPKKNVANPQLFPNKNVISIANIWFFKELSLFLQEQII